MYPRNPAYQPTVLSTFNSVMSFRERLQNTIYYAIQATVASRLETSFQKLRVEHNLDETKHISNAFKKVALRFVLAHHAIDYVGHQPPSTILLGGYIEGPKQTMETSLVNILDSSPQGVVVFSLGSMLSAEHSHWVKFFAKAFAQLPYTVIWKLKGDDDDTKLELGNNTYVFPWLPVTDILAHRNAKAFITHGGQNSVHEAAANAVPTIIIALQSEQHFQAQKVTGDTKMAIKLDINTLTTEILTTAVQELILDPVYKTNAEKVSNIIAIKPRDQNEEILYWVNLVVATGGATHLRSAGEEQLEWYQVKLLDVYITLAIIALLTLVILRYILWRMWYLCKYIICKLFITLAVDLEHKKK